MLYLLFEIGPDRYALAARQTVEVIPLLALKRLPQAPRGVAGLFNYRGQPAPALDLCELTLDRPARERLSTRIIVVRVSDEWKLTSDGKAAPASPDTRHPSRFLGLIAEHATQMLRCDERDFVDSGVNVSDAPYLGPVLLDEKGIIQLLHASRLAGLAAKVSHVDLPALS